MLNDCHRSAGPGSNSVAIEMYGDDESKHKHAGSGYTIDGYSLHGDDIIFETHKDGQFTQQLFNRLARFYSDQLESNTIRTKALSAGVLNVLGDLIAQGIELSLDARDIEDDTSSFDGWRVLAMFVEGLCFSGPSMHFAFEFYERLFPIVRHDFVEPIVHENVQLVDANGDAIPVPAFKTEWRNVLIHVAFDQIVMAMWYVAGLMLITCVIEGHYDELGAELQNDYLRNLGVSWLAAALFFAPIQIFAFGKLPQSY